MQTREQLLSVFDHACAWNALLYLIYKACATGLTFFLIAVLDSTYFSLYANVMSLIFLILLWADCGFKKSIARFLPEYDLHGASFNVIVHKLLAIRSLVLLCALPLCLYSIHSSCIFLEIAHYSHILLISAGIFCAEGILLFLQLIYHAYFLNRYFNSLNTIGLLFHCMSAFTLCMYSSSQEQYVVLILYSKAIISFGIAIMAYIFLWYIKPLPKNPRNDEEHFSELNKQFAVHSGYMWASTALKSITERNALMPIFTYSLGTAHANIFKVAHDSALFFYRIALKTIGTNDTAVFTRARIYKKNVVSVFHHVHQKVTLICIATVLLFIPVFVWHTSTHSTAINLFFIITICYLLEVFLSPYERILEVEQKYRALFVAYIPYLAFVIMMLSTTLISYVGLFSTIALIHVIRLLSATLLVFQAKKHCLRTKTTALPV